MLSGLRRGVFARSSRGTSLRSATAVQSTASTEKKDILASPVERLKLNPVVQHYAKAVPTRTTATAIKHWSRNQLQHGATKKFDFAPVKTVDRLRESDARAEALRCLKCADAPCRASCPSQVDPKQFISMIRSGNYYGAAQKILNDNPLGYSCGMVCPTSKLCAGSCNLHASAQGPIMIGELQEFALDAFRQMGIAQTRDPSAPDVSTLPESFQAPIALVGCGPASISCATYLGRLGYTNVTVFEKNPIVGGLSNTEIPQFRLPDTVVNWEVELMKDLGAKVVTGKALGRDFTLDSLRADGFKAIFLGMGNGAAKSDAVFEGLTPAQGYFTSKDFLPAVSAGSKPTLKAFLSVAGPLPELAGRTVVFGAGDTAMDCASSAFRCGASRVTVALRRGTPDMRAAAEEWDLPRKEHTELLPYVLPKKVLLDEQGKIRGLEMYKTEQTDSGEYVVDEDQTITIKCNSIVSAFGADLDPTLAAELGPLLNDKGWLVADSATGATQVADVFAGGDVAGSGMTVEAANDGKLSSWGIHRFLQQQAKQIEDPGPVPLLPKFFTRVDKVDLSLEFAGKTFINPFGLASAPPTTSAEMIKRSYDQGWGFAVTKTFSLDKDLIVNISPRITRGGTQSPGHPGPNQSSFINIELISEKRAEYWCNAIKELKKVHPDKINVASIMCAFDKDDWQELATMACEANSDMLELNLSCPHGMADTGMGLACGQDPELVREISKWVAEVAGDVPFFIKLTPNITDVVDLALAAKEGGATGVTAINTVSGLVPVSQPRPLGVAVGHTAGMRQTTFGGLAGNAIKPIALRDVTAVAQRLPGYPIMGVGGVDSADSTLEFLEAGAGVVQVCSAVMNQDFSVIEDYVSGLKTRLYTSGREDLKDWQYQSPKLDAIPRNLVDSVQHKGLPDFGPYIEQKWGEREKAALAFGPSEVSKHTTVPGWQEEVGKVRDRDSTAVKVPRLNDFIGIAAKANNTVHADLPREEQVFAKVAEDLCLNCGRCYQACNDNGYQAIEFDEQTHLPNIREDLCTGCGLCLAVCPAVEQGCITLHNRAKPLPPIRG